MKSKLLLFKTAATVLVTAALLYPFFSPETRAGVFAFLETFGLLPAVVVTAVFLIGVALYCRSLQRCLSLIHPARRAAQPRSVWFMFLLPYNFVEDFFIIYNVTRSLRLEAQTNSRLRTSRSFGAISGYGWCAAQIVSLLPNRAGEVAGVVALSVGRCIGIVRINRALASKEPRTWMASVSS